MLHVYVFRKSVEKTSSRLRKQLYELTPFNVHVARTLVYTLQCKIMFLKKRTNVGSKHMVKEAHTNGTLQTYFLRLTPKLKTSSKTYYRNCIIMLIQFY